MGELTNQSKLDFFEGVPKMLNRAIQTAGENSTV